MSDSASTAATPTDTPPPERLQPSAPSVAATPAGPTQLQLLNRAMLGWEMGHHRHPRNFEEFAGTANVPIPAPPAGQKYAISPRGFIVLVNSNQ